MIEIQLMKAKLRFIYLLVGLAAIFSSCRTSAPRLDYQALARASILLGVDVNLEDNHKLYLQSWKTDPLANEGLVEVCQIQQRHHPTIQPELPFDSLVWRT